MRRVATRITKVHPMRKLFIALSVACLGFAACEKPSSTTPPPADTAGGAPTDTAGADTATPGDSAGGDTAGGSDGGGSTEPGAPGVKWADKTDKQKLEHMGIVVLPTMKKEFQAYDGAQFGTFKCETCHGANGKDKGWHMPDDSMYPLDKADPIKAAKEYDEKVTKFMDQVVTPKMAEMLDSPRWSPSTPNGVGCFTCHPAAG
jgi:hypothetical protein